MDAKLVGEWMSQVLGITNVQPVEADLELCMLAAAYGAKWARSSESDGDAQLRLDGEELRRCFDIGKSPDVPYPGMSAAFERHYAQSFNDKDWHNEASVWAAAWKAAKAHTAEQSEPVKYRLWFNEAGEPIADIESPDQDIRLATAIQHRDGFRRQLEDLRHEMDDLEADFSEQQMKSVEWAVEKWMAEVANRPLVNVHRRTLDDTWRTVIKHFGGDDSKLLPLERHDDLVANDICNSRANDN